MGTKITYKRVFYHHVTKQYSANKPKKSSPTVEKSFVPSVDGHIAPTPATEGSLDANQSQNDSTVAADPSGAGVQVQNAPPTVATEDSSNDAQGALMTQIERADEMAVPDDVFELANSSIDLDTHFNDMLKHNLWKDTSIPEYDVYQSHMPDSAPMDPEDSSSRFNFFWQDEDMDYI